MTDIDPVALAALAELDQLKAEADSELDEWLDIVDEVLEACKGDPHKTAAVLCQSGSLEQRFREQWMRWLNLFLAASVRLAQLPDRGRA